MRALRLAGFRVVSALGGWVGLATIDEAEAMAEVHHGKVRRIDRAADDVDDLPLAAE